MGKDGTRTEGQDDGICCDQVEGSGSRAMLQEGGITRLDTWLNLQCPEAGLKVTIFKVNPLDRFLPPKVYMMSIPSFLCN